MCLASVKLGAAQPCVVPKGFSVSGRACSQLARKKRVTRRRGSAHDLSCGLLTQNVMGLGAENERQSRWFTHFRQTVQDGMLDITCLQETRVPVNGTAAVTELHLLSWGFVADGENQFSLWSPSVGRSGGLAILLRPYSRISSLQAFQMEHWTAHWKAATAILGDREFTIIIVYAPVLRSER
uniref:Endonuclease/exonuclease/phosphatase domain-containing protein n=1 Tax=Peronospora matthiolae TaxID=2874970 RepID=A0AAV1TYC5_9STRA